MADTICGGCGKLVPGDAPGGLCPQCLMQRALGDSADETEAVTTGRQRGELPVDPAEPDPGALTPELSGRYKILQETARGGMGKVFLVRDAQLGREVALKQLLASADDAGDSGRDRSALARFTREARVTAQLQHPAITPVYELGRRADGSFYYTMKFVRGRTLAAALQDARSLEQRLKLIPSFIALCHAIAFAHSRGVIHRDIKPSNVMLGEFGETMVVDWGLAKIKGVAEECVAPGERKDEVSDIDGLKTALGTALGTPAYMPPEQAQGLVDALDERSDIYSLGAVLYELLAGRRPYSGSTARELLSRVLSEPAPPLRSLDAKIPREYAEICAQAMARNPAERLASAEELAERVQDVRLQPPKGSLRRTLERVLVAAVLLAPLAVWLLNWRSDVALSQALERLASKGVDLRTGPRDFAAGVRRGPGRGSAGPRNAAGALYALAWDFPELANKESDWWKKALKLDVREKGFPWPAGSPAEAQVRSIVAENVALLASIKSTAVLPRGGARSVIEMAMGEAGNPLETELPKATPLRGAAMLLAYEAYLAGLDRSPDRALASVATGLEYARHLEELPWLVSLLLRAILTEVALAPLEHTELAGASEEALAEVEAALRDGAIAPSLPWSVECEIRGTLFVFDLVRNRPVSEIGMILADSPFSLATLGWAAYGRGPFRFWSNSDEVLYLGFMTDSLEASRRPYHEALPDLTRIDRESEPYQGWKHPMIALLLVHVSGSAERAALVDSRLAQARIRVALERWRKQRKTYPGTLLELAPVWLDKVPIHALTGHPFRYTKTAEGYQLEAPASSSLSAR